MRGLKAYSLKRFEWESSSLDSLAMQKLEDQFLAGLAESYDRQPYFSNVFPWSAPGYVRAAAHLYGIQTPPVANARILELGCAAGGNCIPIASLYPDAEVVGVDISTRQIAAGQRVIEQAGLTNIRLLNHCFSRLPKDLGQFDYIIAHGVWSWVPEVVQQALLQVCQQHLQPQGAAYISFNTYPGWKLQEVFREAMLFHCQQYGAPTHVERAREILPFFMHGLAAENPLQEALVAQAGKVPSGAENDYYIAHEYLELHNLPIYLQDFVQRLARHDLHHVGDVELRNECAQRYGDEFAQHFELFAQGHKGVVRQQYLDFAVGRQFRKSLVVHQAWAAHQKPEADLNRLKDLQFAGWFELQCQNKDSQERPIISFYHTLQQETLRVDDPVHQTWLKYLHECWPRPVSGRDLLRIAAQTHPEYDAQELDYRFQRLYVQVPLSLSRSYEDLPPCLHDLYEGLIPGVYPLMIARQNHALGMGDFNAWFQTSTAQFDSIQHLILKGLAQQLDWTQIAITVCAQHPEIEPNQAHQTIDDLVANLRKYALYI